MHRKQCLEYNVKNTIHRMSLIEFNAINTMYKKYIYNEKHAIKRIKENAWTIMHRTQWK